MSGFTGASAGASASPLVELLGPKLQVGASGEVETASVLEGKEVVGLYFSAHWCPPCRMFTPMLADWYRKLTTDGKPLEVVFISSDRSKEAFDEYFAEHPWKALPFQDRDAKARIAAKFKVQGIPMLVLLDVATGKVINDKGREAVMNDPEGEAFPYRPIPLGELLQGPLTDSSGATTTVAEAMTGKDYLLLYFSASWCPPCQRFTPVLAKCYEGFKAAGRGDLEVVFVSSDRDQASFASYLSHHPWKAIPFGDKRINGLSQHFDVEGIPTLIVLHKTDNDYRVVNDDTVGFVHKDPTGKEFPWAPKPVTDLAQGVKSSGFDINSKPALVVLMENADDDEQASISASVGAVAAEFAEEGNTLDDGPRVIFFTATGPCQAGEKVRVLTKAGDVAQSTDPTVVLLDIPDRGGYYTWTKGDDLSESAIRAFLQDYFNKSLARKQLGE